MSGWLSRLLGRSAAPAAPASPAKVGQTSPSAMPSASPVAVASRPPAAAAQAASAASAAATQFGLRRPLVGNKGNVAGFEVRLPTALEQRLLTRADPAAWAANQALLLAAAAPVCKAGRMALMQVGVAALMRPGVAQHAQPGALLCVDDLAQLPPDMATELRARGVRLGVNDGPAQASPAADFIWLQAAAGGLDTLLLSAQQWRAAQPKVPLVASGLQHLDDVERLLRSGFTLAGGVLDRASVVPSSKPVSAAAQRICELLNHLSLDRDTAVVADAVRADVALSYRLLRYVNSPAVGLRRNVETIDAAVMLLGRQELYRWLSVLLLTVAESRQASQALQETALARGRLLEMLARARNDPAPQTLFTVGMLSLVEVLLQMPMADALKPLRLGDALLQALLQGQGPYAEYLALAKALDGGDIASVDGLAQPWGGADAVQVMADAAWAWAEAVASGAAAPAP